MRWTVHKRHVYQLALALAFAFMAFWIGGRDISVGADTQSYSRFYAEKVACKCVGSKEIGFEIVGLIPAFLGLSSQAFFTLVAIIIFALTLYIVRRVAAGVLLIDRLKEWRLYFGCSIGLIGILMLNPLYAQSHINALRHGLASLCLVLFVVELAQRRYRHSLFWAVVAVSFHLSALLHLPLVLAVIFTRGRRPAFIAWVMTLVTGVYLLGVTDDLTRMVSPGLYSFVDDYGSHALGRYKTGVRVDFAVFTYVLAMGSLWLSRMSFFPSPSSARILAEAAGLSSIPFYILGWGVFSNRYLFSSWLMFSVFAGIVFGGLVYARRLPASATLVIFVLGISMLIYQITVG